MVEQLIDTHVHLGFFKDPLAAAQELVAAGVGVLCATTCPAEYEHLAAAGVGVATDCEPSTTDASGDAAFISGAPAHTPDAAPSAPAHTPDTAPTCILGVGLHPWQIADGTCSLPEIERAAELAANTRLVSEIGLDFAAGREEQGEAQIAAFEQMLAACANGGHILSIHAVNAAGEVLRLLQAHKTLSNNTVIFHWFSGSSYELLQARKMGCYFSVGSRMLESKRGRSYAQQIELDHLLLETDMPANAHDGLISKPASLADELTNAVDMLVSLRADLTDRANAIASIAHNTRELLS